MHSSEAYEEEIARLNRLLDKRDATISTLRGNEMNDDEITYDVVTDDHFDEDEMAAINVIMNESEDELDVLRELTTAEVKENGFEE